MTGYAEWVDRRTAQPGITRALCVMREGRLLKELIESVASRGVTRRWQCELLWASRAAIARANVSKADAAEVAALFNRPRIPSVAEAGRTLGIDPSAVPGGAELAEEAAQHAGNRRSAVLERGSQQPPAARRGARGRGQAPGELCRSSARRPRRRARRRGLRRCRLLGRQPGEPPAADRRRGARGAAAWSVSDVRPVPPGPTAPRTTDRGLSHEPWRPLADGGRRPGPQPPAARAAADL